MTDLPSRVAALVAELKRRRVLNVAAVYLVGMWILIQVADVTFTRLGLPDWTVTFVIVAGALAFPVVVALAWAFDLTRTPTTDAASDVPAPAPGAPPSSSTRPSSATQRRLAVAMAALMAVPLLGFGFWWTGVRGLRGADLDDDLVAVMPFRLAGASPELGWMREGLMDLIAPALGGLDAELEVVPPREVSRRIMAALGSVEVDPDRDEARGIATTFGAGRLLEGDVVGTGAGFTVNARLYDVRTGHLVDDVEITAAHPDSIHAVVDRLAARFMAAQSGLREDRLASVTTASVPALRAFVEGERAFRRGDHHRALDAYDRAVSLDSTFALAALGLLRVQGWSMGLPSENGPRADRIVRRGMDRLGEVDRAFYLAFAGEDGPEPYRQLVEGRIAAARRYPDIPELQYLAGDGIMHYGRGIGLAQPYETAREYFRRTVAMDSTYLEPLLHLRDLALAEGDTAAFRHWGRLLLAVDTTESQRTAMTWAEAMLEGTTDGVPFAVDTLGLAHLQALGQTQWLVGVEPGLLEGLRRAARLSPTQGERESAGYFAIMEGMLAGVPSLVDAGDQAYTDGYLTDADRLALTLYWWRDQERAAATGAEVRRGLDQLRAATPEDAPVPAGITDRACMLGHLSVAREETGAAASWADLLEAAVRSDRSPWTNTYDRFCAQFLRAAVAVHSGASDARARMQALDDSLGAGVRRRPVQYPVFDLAAVHLWERLGEPERALEAARRRTDLPDYAMFHSELNAENARLAEQLGHTEEAIRLYEAFLSWRSHAEGVFAERAERAREALTRLRGRG